MDADTSPAPSSKPAATHSCQRCAVRKIRCNKQRPCNACVKANAECEQRVIRPPQRRKRANRNEILSGRLAQYERLLQQKDTVQNASTETPDHKISSSLTTNESISTTKDSSPLQTPNAVIARPLRVSDDAQLLHDRGRSKYLDKLVYQSARILGIADCLSVVCGQEL